MPPQFLPVISSIVALLKMCLTGPVGLVLAELQLAPLKVFKIEASFEKF